MEDCLHALDWVHENANKYDIDRDRIVLSGGSSGGHLALLTGLLRNGDRLCGGALTIGNHKKAAAIVNWYGVTDFSINPPPIEWFGENVDVDEYARTLSPVNYVREGGIPIITIHGTEDTWLPVKQAIKLHGKLREVGVDEKLHLVNGKKHGNFNPEELTEIYQEI